MRKAIVVVDMQKDFVTGSLGTKEAQAIIPNMVKFLDEKFAEGYHLYATKDTHYENYLETQEGKNLPVPHTIKGTDGWELVPELHKFEKDMIIFEKPTFGSIELMEYCRDNKYEEVILVGVCTGICVISNATLIKAALPECKVNVVKNLCACVTPDSHETALKAMELLQVGITEY